VAGRQLPHFGALLSRTHPSCPVDARASFPDGKVAEGGGGGGDDGDDCNLVQSLAVPMHLGLIDGPFVPHFNSWEPWYLTKVPDGPQTYRLNIFWLQTKEP
jgi:hypothetical protein